MKLSQLTQPHLITLSSELTSKADILQELCQQFFQQGYIDDPTVFYQDVMKREAISPTGIDHGIAIPHGKSSSVRQAGFAFLSLKKPLTSWESVVETNQVQYIFLLAIPQNDEQQIQMKMLSHLMGKLSQQSYLDRLTHAKTPQEFIQNLDECPFASQRLVAVTACTMGIAHTYLAAQALQQAAHQLDVEIFVEKQGAHGIDDPLTNSQIQQAHAVIIAADVQISHKERFDSLPQIQVRVAEPIKDAQNIILKALQASSVSPKRHTVNIKKTILTSLQGIIPFLILYAFLMILKPCFTSFSFHDFTFSQFLLFFHMLLFPILSANIAYTLAQQRAGAIAFLLSLLLSFFQQSVSSSLIIGFLCGYSYLIISQHFPIQEQLSSLLMQNLIYPLLTLIVSSVLCLLCFPLLNLWQQCLSILSTSSYFWLFFNGIIAIMTVYDLGGPINKWAYLIAILSLIQGYNSCYFIFTSAKMISLWLMCLTTFRTQDFKKNVIYLVCGITENALPCINHRFIQRLLCLSTFIMALFLGPFSIGLSLPGIGIFSILFLQSSHFILAILLFLSIPFLSAVILFFIIKKTHHFPC